MAKLATQSDVTKWYSKINVLRKQSGIGASTISESSSVKTNVMKAARMTAVIDQINTARNLHTLLQQSTTALSKTNISTDYIAKESTVNNIESSLLAMLRTCINQTCTNQSYSGDNIAIGNGNYYDNPGTGCNVSGYGLQIGSNGQAINSVSYGQAVQIGFNNNGIDNKGNATDGQTCTLCSDTACRQTVSNSTISYHTLYVISYNNYSNAGYDTCSDYSNRTCTDYPATYGALNHYSEAQANNRT